MRKVYFYFPDGRTWPGYTDDSRWNGWLNVEVDPKVFREICDDKALGADDPFQGLTMSENGRYDLGNCYCTSEDEDYAEYIESRRWCDDLSKEIEVCFNDEAVRGWLYLDSYYVEWIERLPGDNRPEFNVVLDRGEYLFPTLDEAEYWLWDKFVRAEYESGLKEASEANTPTDDKTMLRMERLAEIAKPISEDDYGSDDQVKAQNYFFVELEKLLSTEDFEAVESYALKATPEEMIDYGLARLKSPVFGPVTP